MKKIYLNSFRNLIKEPRTYNEINYLLRCIVFLFVFFIQYVYQRSIMIKKLQLRGEVIKEEKNLFVKLPLSFSVEFRYIEVMFWYRIQIVNTISYVFHTRHNIEIPSEPRTHCLNFPNVRSSKVLFDIIQ